MSSVELREAVFDWPRRARSLLTVRAAISFARLVDMPELRSLSTMCSYLRSCVFVHSGRGIAATSLHDRLAEVGPHGCDDAGGLIEGRASLHEVFDAVDEVGVVPVEPRRPHDAGGDLRLVSELSQPRLLPVLHPRLLGRLGLGGGGAGRPGISWGPETHLHSQVPGPDRCETCCQSRQGRRAAWRTADVWPIAMTPATGPTPARART